MQELKGSALLEFLMKKQGITWDSTTVDNVALQDLDNESFNEFRKKAIKSGRLSVDDLKVTDEELLDLFGLRAKGKLTVAAVLLFHKNPEKFIFGSYVKIGFFANDSDLRYQDEVYGPLVMLPDKIIELFYLKYFKGWITYEGLIRVENYPAPQEAMREAVLNALIHRDYTTGIPIQIKVFDDKIIIFNDGKLPDELTIDELLKTHRSLPRNKLIANAIYKTGLIEQWGEVLIK